MNFLDKQLNGRDKVSHRDIGLRPAVALLTSSFVCIFSNPAAAANRVFDLYLMNVDNKPVTMTLSTENNNCYEGSPGLAKYSSM